MPSPARPSAEFTAGLARARAAFDKQEKEKHARLAVRNAQGLNIRVTPPQSPSRMATNDDDDDDPMDTFFRHQQSATAKDASETNPSVTESAATQHPIAESPQPEAQVASASGAAAAFVTQSDASEASSHVVQRKKRGGRVKGSKNKKTLARLANGVDLELTAAEARRKQKKREWELRRKENNKVFLSGKLVVDIVEVCGGRRLCVDFDKYKFAGMDLSQKAALHMDFTNTVTGRTDAENFLQRGAIKFNVPRLKYRKCKDVFEMHFTNAETEVLRFSPHRADRLFQAVMEWRSTSEEEKQFGFVRRLWCRSFPEPWMPMDHFLNSDRTQSASVRLCFHKNGDDMNFMDDNLVTYNPTEEAVRTRAPWFFPISLKSSVDNDSTRTYRVRCYHHKKEHQKHRTFSKEMLDADKRRRFCELVEMCVKKDQMVHESRTQRKTQGRKRKQPEVQQPEAEHPEAEQPEAGQPEAEHPEAEHPAEEHAEAEHTEAEHTEAEHTEAQHSAEEHPAVENSEIQEQPTQEERKAERKRRRLEAKRAAQENASEPSVQE